MKINKAAFRESIADTALALPIAWALSYCSLFILLQFSVNNAFTLSLFQTMILTFASVLRKYFVRVHFHKRGNLRKLY